MKCLGRPTPLSGFHLRPTLLRNTFLAQFSRSRQVRPPKETPSVSATPAGQS